MPDLRPWKGRASARQPSGEAPAAPRGRDTASTAHAPGDALLLPFEFAGFRVDPAHNELHCAATGACHKLEPRTMHVLVLLAQNAGQVVSRETFADTVWPGRRVVADSLSQCISELRKILDDDARAPRYIRTVPKRGYCFLPQVTREPVAPAPVPAAGPARRRAHGGAYRLLGTGLLLALLAAVVMLGPDTGGGARDAASPQPGDLMPLLSGDVTVPRQLRWPGAAQAAEAFLVERSWLGEDRVRLQLRDDTGVVVWSAEHPVSTEEDRRRARENIVEVLALASDRESGPALAGLPLAQQRLYRRARHHLDRRTEADLLTARELLEEILSQAPDSVEAILLMAELQRGLARHDPSRSGPVAYHAARDALIQQAALLAPEHPAVQALDYQPEPGAVDWQRYEADLKSLVSRAPDCAACVRRLSEFYLQVGWYEEALAVWERHRRYWPLSVSVHASIARLQMRLGNAEEGLRQVGLIRALAGDDGWDVDSAEAEAYLLRGDEERMLAIVEPLFNSLGERGQLRLQVLAAARADDSQRLRELARQHDATDSVSFALILGQIDEVAAMIVDGAATGDYHGLSVVHGAIWEPNRLNRHYLAGLARLRRHPRIQSLLEATGLRDFWRVRGRYPDYCRRSSSRPPYCA